MVILCDTCRIGHFHITSYGRNFNSINETNVIKCDKCKRILFMTVYYGGYEPITKLGPRYGFDWLVRNERSQTIYELKDIVDMEYVHSLPPEFNLSGVTLTQKEHDYYLSSFGEYDSE